MRRSFFMPIVVVAGLAAAGPAFAHAHLRASTPESGSVGPAPKQLDISFSEGLEPKFSSIEVTDSAGAHVDKGDLHIVGGDAKHVAVGLKPLAPGAYTVIWHATSVDTHKTEGTFTFTVTK